MKNKKEILDLINGEQPLVLHFYTTDCEKHKENKRALRRLEKESEGLSFQTINVLINKQLGLADELDIDGAPSVLLFLGGKERWRRAGVVSEEKMKRVLKQVIAEV